MDTKETIQTLNSSKVNLGKNYLEINPEVTDKELGEIFRAITVMNGSTLFWAGDFLAALEEKKGEAYSRLYASTDYSPQTLYNAKTVCKRIPKALRANLSFSHHKEALTEAKGNVAIAVDFLRKAEAAGQSVKEMRQSIRRALADSLPPEETNMVNIIDPEMLRLHDAFYTIRRFLENTNSTTFGLRKEFVRAELEALAEWANNVCGSVP